MKFYQSLIDQSIHRMREATLGTLKITNPALRKHLDQTLTAPLGSNESYFSAPVFEQTFGWKLGNKQFKELEGKPFCKSFLNVLAKANNYGFNGDMYPYEHQLKAWDALTDNIPKSAIITSGTGSGKTECFMMPILNDLVSEYENNQGNKLKGVRALFLYPLNALINSQKERLDEWTNPYQEGVRFCLYNGNTIERKRSVSNEQKETPNQILSRELLREEPAPILLTNATMLEYMLVRQQDAPIIQQSKKNKTLRWIVLDEAHTYIGSQAAEIALLLRRVVLAFGVDPKDIRFVATSATIAGDDSEKELKAFLASLAGVDPSQVVVITGEREWDKLDHIELDNHQTLEQILAIDPESEISAERFEALASNYLARKLRALIVDGDEGKPWHLNDLVSLLDDQLEGSLSARQQTLLKWIDLMTGTFASQDSDAFLKVRAHFFQRLLYGLWACIDPGCPDKSSYLQEGWTFGNVYTLQQDRCSCGAPVYELVFCSDCQTPHLLAEDVGGVLSQRTPFIEDEFTLNEEWEDGTIREVVEDVGLSEDNQWLVTSTLYKSDSFFPTSLDLETGELGIVQSEKALDILFTSRTGAECISCKKKSEPGKDFYRANYLAAPFFLPHVIPTLLEYCPDAEKEDSLGKSPLRLPAFGRRLITFTDSRQNTARHTVKMQQEAERSRTRGAIYKITQNYQPESSYDSTTLSILKAHNYEHYLTIIQNTPKLNWGDLRKELSDLTDFKYQMIKDNRGVFEPGNEVTDLCQLMMARELMHRPKFANSLETLGILQTIYPKIDQLTEAPQYWKETKIVNGLNKGDTLTLKDWQDFLYYCIDFHIRARISVSLSFEIVRWLGMHSYPTYLIAVDSPYTTDNKIKRWPQIKEKQYISVLPRLLLMVTGLDSKKSTDRDKINDWLKKAWDFLVKNGYLVRKDYGFQLPLESMHFDLVQSAWVCPVTSTLLARTFQGVSPYTTPKMIESGNYLCEQRIMPDYKELIADASNEIVTEREQIRQKVKSNETVLSLRREGFWSNLSDSVVEGGFYYRAAEHSAQQSAKTLQRYEGDFKQGELNVLNCSTTMEMGVDIGGISAVVMNNLPPHPANYLQRAGRAGRRKESRSIAYTLCNNSPHNLRAFKTPKWAFETIIAAPNITLSSERIIHRHVNSLFLSLFLNEYLKTDEDNTRLNLVWFYTENGDNCPANQFLVFLKDTVQKNEKIKEMVRSLVKGTKLENAPLHDIAETSVHHFRVIKQSWLDEYKKIENKLKKVASKKDEAYRAALEIEKSRHEKEYLLKELSAKAFLPVHGFPTDITVLHTMNIESYKVEQRVKKGKKGDNFNEEREDSLFSFKGNPTRNLNIALQEYAPGSQIVMDGRVYRSAGISLEWQRQGTVKEDQQIDILWHCGNCGEAGIESKAYTNNERIICTNCSVVVQKKQKLLKPGGFRVDFFEPTTNDIRYREFIKQMPPVVSLDALEISLPDKQCGHIRFGYKGEIIYSSSGKNGHGYAICYECGRGESMTDRDQVPDLFRAGGNHRPLGGGVDKAERKATCSNEHVWQNIYLGYSVHTDVFELYLKNPKNGEYLVVEQDGSTKNRIIARTIAVALRDLFAEHLGIAAKEMGFSIKENRQSKEGARRWVIQIYDSAAGGAGFVTTAAKDIDQILMRLKGKLECSRECQSACPFCLTATDSFVEREEINRLIALEWLNKTEWLYYLNSSLENSSNHYKYRFYPGSAFEFVLLGLQRQSIQNTHAKLRLFLPESRNEYALDHPKFKQQLFNWLYEGIEVTVVIPQNHLLSEEETSLLNEVVALGTKVAIVAIEDAVVDGNHIALELSDSNSDTALALLTKNPEMILPSDYWLLPTTENSWLSTEKESTPIQYFELQNDADKRSEGQYIEFTDQTFMCKLTEFSEVFSLLLEENAPVRFKQLKEEGIKSIAYYDRYFHSPWYLIIATQLLLSLGIEKGTLESIEIHTLEPNRDGQYRQDSISITHNWPESTPLENVLGVWLDEIFSPKKLTNIKIYDSRAHLQHGRELQIVTNQGNHFILFFDQGMGFWKPKCLYRDDYYLKINSEDLQETFIALIQKMGKIDVRTEGKKSYMIFIDKDNE